MLEIKKVEAPDFFNLWIKDNKENSQRLRGFILENEQRNVCCYCEKKISPVQKESHIDHIRPQDKFPKLKHDYCNLAVSCMTANRCGNSKGNQFNMNFIVPTEENPLDYLTYSASGEIRSINDNPKGIETIKILNLNASSLVGARRVMFIKLEAMKDSIDDFSNYFHEYPTLIDYFRENY